MIKAIIHTGKYLAIRCLLLKAVQNLAISVSYLYISSGHFIKLNLSSTTKSLVLEPGDLHAGEAVKQQLFVLLQSLGFVPCTQATLYPHSSLRMHH